MHDTVRAVSRFYLAAVVWFAVMVATAMALLGPMDALYSAIEAGPLVRAFGNIAIAVVVATAVAFFVWSRLGTSAPSTGEESHTVGSPVDNDHEAALVTINR